MAVSLLPESAVRPGMRILSPADGFPALAPIQIGIMKRPGMSASLMNAVTEHIVASLDNITPAVTSPSEDQADNVTSMPMRARFRHGQAMAGW